MRYIEVMARVSALDAERTAEAMQEITNGGTWIDAPFTQADLESDAVVLGDAPRVVRAYIPADSDRAGVILDVRARLDALGVEADIEARVIADEDWAEAWKEHFHVERYGDRIVVVPSWRSHDPLPDDVIIRLDPGMAFGTGQHETTRMCLEAIERTVVDGMRVLDVGCGSGILAIAAAKLGASKVMAVDIDPVCVRVAGENARMNEVDVEAAEGSLGAAWPLDEPAVGFDLVVANIIARAITGMAGQLAAALAPGGRLIASGIIAEHEDAVAASLVANGLRLERTTAMGEWRCIEAKR